jgi:hypothetical protein
MPETVILLLKKLKTIQNQSFIKLNGLFPSGRSHPLGYKREDYSAYFTATLYHSLERLKPLLTSDEKNILEEIRIKACLGLAPFQNKQGLQRYNFWQTNPGKHFPNGYLLGRWDYFRPPDDVDDSVMIYQLQKRNWEESNWLMAHIDSYANGEKKWIKNTPEPYQKLNAWCTFFCRDMPLGFDACVISNVLYFNLLHGFPKNKQYQDSIRYLYQMLEEKDHILRPEKVSPYYPHASIIIYHLAKLLSSFEIPELLPFKENMKSQMIEILESSLFESERAMLENAWMWLFDTNPPSHLAPIKKGRFYFFVLPLTLEFEGKIPQFFAHNRLSHIRFHSEALEIAFNIEKQVLKRKFTSNPKSDQGLGNKNSDV